VSRVVERDGVPGRAGGTPAIASTVGGTVPADGAQDRPPRAGGRRGTRSLQQRRRRTGLLLVSLPVLFVTVFFLAPLALMIFMSLNKWPLLGEHSWLGLGNYTKILDDNAFKTALWFTLKYTLVLTPVLFVVGFGLAFLVKNPRPGVGIFRTVYFIPVVLGLASASYLAVFLFNPQVGTIGKVLTDLHITSSPPEWLSTPNLALVAVALTITWKTVGFTMLLLMTGLQSIPEELNEAATVDGAGHVNTLWHITLPLLRKTIALALIFSVAGSMLAFDQFYIMTGGGPQNQTITVVYRIYNTSFISFDLGYGAAMSVVLMVILMIISGIQLFLLREDTEH
jgi:multiple sugar transport system permease protein